MRQQPSDRVMALGDSPSNRPWSNIGPENFLHFYQQLDNVLAQSPRRVLEVGPGDHTVTDFLRRKGVEVDTVDFDAELHPDFVRDLRQPLDLPRAYDVVLAAEVLEHMPFRWFDTAGANPARAPPPGCRVV